jgi:galactokinase/mevalonate kinase-like predicted kinase
LGSDDQAPSPLTPTQGTAILDIEIW